MTTAASPRGLTRRQLLSRASAVGASNSSTGSIGPTRSRCLDKLRKLVAE